MAKHRPAKKRDENKPAEQHVLPMQLQVGDRLTDETGEWEVASRPYVTNAGKDTSASRRLAWPEVTELRTWAAHERVSVRRA